MITSVLTDVLDAQFGVTVLSSFSGSHLAPIIENLSAGQYRLVIPIGEEAGKPVVAVGTLDADPSEILEKLLGLAVRYVRQGRRLEEQLLDLDGYAQQVSRDFEELTWMRGLLEHLRDCNGSGSAEDLVRAILLPLCPLIGAKQVILVSVGQEGTSPGQKVTPVGKVLVQVGPGEQIEQIVDDQSCCKLVDRLREVADGQSLVQTGMKRRREFSMVPDVDSCILVPVTKQESLLGWLLAVNQMPTTVDPDTTTDSAISHLPEDDFGTFEANLLDFAAVVLAAHAHCTELFAEGASADKECVAPN